MDVLGDGRDFETVMECCATKHCGHELTCVDAHAAVLTLVLLGGSHKKISGLEF